MPRIILKCPYLKPGKTADHRANYVRYIGTRPGVDKIDDSRRHLPVTKNQEQLIRQLTKDFPDTKELFEYRDYLAKPTVENASEFIAQAIDQNFSRLGKRENYVDYIAKRPRAERVGDHGLFTDEGVPVLLQEVAREVAEHKGNVWLPIVSLRREDAQRLGYDSGQAWRELLRSQAEEIARCFKIKREHFRWYASFHDESHHPHVHMVCYSTDPREGYLTVKGIEDMKSGLAKQIFRQDLLEIYSGQTERRNELNRGGEEVMRELCAQVLAGTSNERAGRLILELSERLKNTGGKKVYGYLPPDMRRLVDGIVDELVRDERIEKMYDLWYEKRFDVLRTYTDQLPDKIPLSQQREFKTIRNMVIREALELGRGSIPDDIPLMDTPDAPPLPEEAPPATEATSGDDKLQYRLGQMLRDGVWPTKDTAAALAYFEKSAKLGNVHAMHALAKLYLDSGEVDKIKEAIRWLIRSADGGNALARYSLGKFYLKGEHLEKDVAKAVELLTASAEQGNQFARYTLGKLYLSGEDVPKDVAKAVELLTASAQQGNQFAQYALGKFYFMGREVERDKEKALAYFTASAAQGNEYAAFFLEHIPIWERDAVMNAAVRLARSLARMMEEDYRARFATRQHTDRKLLQKLARKKEALGVKISY